MYDTSDQCCEIMVDPIVNGPCGEEFQPGGRFFPNCAKVCQICRDIQGHGQLRNRDLDNADEPPSESQAVVNYLMGAPAVNLAPRRNPKRRSSSGTPRDTGATSATDTADGGAKDDHLDKYYIAVSVACGVFYVVVVSTLYQVLFDPKFN